MALPLGVPTWYATGTFNPTVGSNATQEIYALSFGKKVGLTLKFGATLAAYPGEFTSITVLADSTTFTIATWDEGADSDANTNSLTYAAGTYICGKFKSITMTAGVARIN